jgi:hypothetical protein
MTQPTLRELALESQVAEMLAAVGEQRALDGLRRLYLNDTLDIRQYDLLVGAVLRHYAARRP